jgi:hypothetical protein
LRPWFSSGEDERLGIVVWPPGLFAQDAKELANDLVKTAPENGATHGRVMILNDFHDEDLGPGGKFITRWGGDPIRMPVQGMTSPRTFVPASAFLDAEGETGTGFKAEKVTNVTMPVRTAEEGVQNGDTYESVPQTLKVSLLTYQPKFDVYNEQWYVDVVMEHETEAEPLVRLGLVRYQPHAPENLQVSYAVTQWTQLLPCRIAEVRRSKTGVSIRIEGLATSPAPSRVSAPLDVERPAVPKMTAYVIREFNLEQGVPIRRVITEKTFGAENITYFEDRRDSYQAEWNLDLPLSLNKNEDARERPKYFVFIREQEAMLPATYANEPVSPEMAMGRTCGGDFRDDLLVEGGPRFLARIPLQ